VDDPVAPAWVRQDNLSGCSVFVGANYPFFLEPSPLPAARAADVGEIIPVFKPDCVFATHRGCSLYMKTVPDWCRLPLDGGPAIGSVLQYSRDGWGIRETPMWFVPTLEGRD